MPLEVPQHGRELRGTRGQIKPGAYVVYHFFAKSLIRCTPDGEMLSASNELGYVFDDLSAAKGYCDWKVSENQALGCLVYDDKRKIVDQIFSVQYLEKHRRANNPRRQLFLGTLLLISGSLLIWIDVEHDWMLIIGFLVGARLAVGGLVKIGLSLMELRKSREPAKVN